MSAAHVAPVRFICSKETPWNVSIEGPVRHPDAVDEGTCYEGCCDKWSCPNCGANWTDANDGEHS